MTRWLPVLALSTLLLAACSSSKPVAAAPEVDPTTDPTIVGAVDEAVLQGSIDAEKIAPTARRVGRVAGVLAAVLGGPQTESVDDIIDRYRMTRDATVATAVSIAASHGAVAGAKRGLEMDQQFAELHAIKGLDVFRPYPDQIDVRLPSIPDRDLLASVAAVFPDREPRAIDIEAAGDVGWQVADVLIEHGVPESSFHVSRNNDVSGVLLRIRYRQ